MRPDPISIGGAVMLVLVVAWWMWPASQQAPAPEAPVHGSAQAAWVAARAMVREQLRAPSAASFGEQGPGQTVESAGTGRYRVRGWVDAPNALGFPIRHDFEVVLQHIHGERYNAIAGPTVTAR
jgi:hypothetical protein